MKSYDAYLFDLYGTLVDIRTDESDPRLWTALAQAFAAHGASYDADDLFAAYREEVAAAEAKALHPDPEIDLTNVFAALYGRCGIVADRACIAETARLFRRASLHRLKLYAGANELLAALKLHGKVILLSNAQRLFTETDFSLLGWAPAFDAVYLSSDYGVKKPSAAFYALPLQEFGLDPARCLMIGNDPVCDVLGARRAGMDAFYIRSAISPASAPPAVPEAIASQPHMDLRRVRRTLLQKGD